MICSFQRALHVLAAAALCSAPTARASDSGWGNLSTIEAFSTGVVLITTTGARSTAPECQATRPDLTGRWALDAGTPAGQSLLSILTTAYALKKRVRITGTATCQSWYDSENIAYIQVEPS